MLFKIFLIAAQLSPVGRNGEDVLEDWDWHLHLTITRPQSLHNINTLYISYRPRLLPAPHTIIILQVWTLLKSVTFLCPMNFMAFCRTFIVNEYQFWFAWKSKVYCTLTIQGLCASPVRCQICTFYQMISFNWID